MYCPKCGKEIKNGNTFCTNCGEAITTDKQNDEKKIIKIKFTHLIIFIIAIALIIGILLVVSLNKGNIIQKYKDSKELTSKGTNIESNNSDKVYITLDSNVSPTGKEFIGEFTENLTNVYQDMTKGNASLLKKYYDTSIENMKQLSIESSLRDYKYTEIVFYYNGTNNKIIGAKQAVNDIQLYEQVANYDNTNTNEVLEKFMTAATNIFLDAHNDNSSQEFLDRYNKYNDYLQKNFSNVGNTDFEYNNYKFTYRVIGDIICVVTTDKFDNNKIEVLLFAHNENNKPEDEIKLWYDTVNVIDENVSDDTIQNFIDEIKSKYPNESEEICTDGEQYWLLDTAGKKIYFYDLESFENALGNTNINETSKNSQNTNNQNSNKKQNELDPYTRQLISFEEGFTIENYTEKLDNWGIKYKVNKVQDLNYENNVVTKIEPNNCYIDKNTIVTLSVSDNTYDMSVIVDTQYLVGLANITGKYSGDKIQLTLKINGQTIFNGTTDVLGMVHSLSLGNISGKPAGTYNIEATVDGVTITKKINYNIRCNSYTQRFEIYAGGDIGGG